MSFLSVVEIIIVLWGCVYTISYGIWAWKKKNRLGAIAVFVLSIAVLALPVYVMFFYT